jgi:hypothetical protein
MVSYLSIIIFTDSGNKIISLNLRSHSLNDFIISLLCSSLRQILAFEVMSSVNF